NLPPRSRGPALGQPPPRALGALLPRGLWVHPRPRPETVRAADEARFRDGGWDGRAGRRELGALQGGGAGTGGGEGYGEVYVGGE
ncbi:hypothetical protein V494_00832, partial [Pseudogymnoascus sp. VKM F-4513 (FW-928)]